MLRSILADCIELAGCGAAVTGTYLLFGLPPSLIVGGAVALLIGAGIRRGQGIDHDLTPVHKSGSKNNG